MTKCPVFGEALTAFRLDKENEWKLNRSIGMFVCIWLFHEWGHIINNHFSSAPSKQKELDADRFAAFHIMRTFEEDYKDLTVEGVLLFSFITSQTFHADVGSPPTTSERFSHFIIDIYDYFRYTKNSAKFEEFDAWNEKNIAAWQKIIDGPDGPPQK